MNEVETFLSKPVAVTKSDNFVLYGIIISREQHGIWLKTKKETSFITYNNIKEIKLDKFGR